MHYAALFSPGKIGTLQLKNRIVMAPMASNFADINGEVTETMIDYYRERARGGAGLIIVEAACVDSPFGREGLNQLRVDQPEFINGLWRLAEEIKSCGSLAFLQLFHAGRQTNSSITGGQPIFAPSPVPCPKMKEVPLELEPDQIEALQAKFINAAHYAYRAGFNGVELHAAHGYLINQFLSPHSNQRTDDYGGSLSRRMKFLLDIINGIKVLLPKFPVSVRLNIDDFVPGGLGLEEGLQVCRELEAAGADIINCSSGTYESGLKSIEPASYQEGWRIYLAARVKDTVNIPVIGGGMIRNPQTADKVIADGHADYIFLGRPLLADPYWPDKAGKGLISEIRPCITCNNCISNNFKGLAICCTVNPYLGRERYERLQVPARRHLKAVVAGGGPAGMQAALSLSRGGFQVQLYEREPELGGFLNLAGSLPHKERILGWGKYLAKQVEKAGIEVILNYKFEPADIDKENPDILVVATGSIPLNLGAVENNCNYYNGNDVLVNDLKWNNQRVAIIGGGSSGCELAEQLAMNNNQVTIVEKKALLAQDMEKKNRRDLLNRLETAGVKKRCASTIKKINPDSIVIENDTGQEEIEYDRLVGAIGFHSDNWLYFEALNKVPQVFLIGDARQVRSFREAIREGDDILSRVLEY